MATNGITNGVDSCDILLKYGYSTTIDLSMQKSVDSRGIVSWLDYGMQYDNFTTKFQLTTIEPQMFEKIVGENEGEQITIEQLSENWLFTPMFDYAQNLSVNVKSWSNKGNLDIFAEEVQYDMEITPNVTGVYSNLVAQQTIQQCSPYVNHWQLDNIEMPFADWESSINDKKRHIQYYGSSVSVEDSAREYGDSVKLKITVSEEQARKILIHLTQVKRSNELLATFPQEYNIFGNRYLGITSARVKLFGEKITVKHKNHRRVEIGFSLQMIGE